MKKVLTLLAAAGLMTAATAAFGGSIVGSKHDLSPTGASAITGANTQICVYCHAPHNANLALPLWNRSNPLGAGFTLYSGVNMQSRQFATGFTNDSTSLFCMSCHDGTTLMSAVHNVGSLMRNGRKAGGPSQDFSASAIGLGNTGFGNDLTKTHPVNFPVPTVNNSQNDLWLGAGGAMGGGATTTTSTFPLFKVAQGVAARNTNRSLECGSCHAVHDSANSPFLRFTMDGSKLCLGCHNK